MRMLSCIFVLLGAILTHLPAHGLRLSTRERDPDAEQPKYNVSAVSLLQNETHDDVGEKHLLPAEDGDNFHSLEQNSVRSGYGKLISAHIVSHMQVDDCSVYCEGLRNGIVVRRFPIVWLSPQEDNLWHIIEFDTKTSPDELTCSFGWTDKVLLYKLYQETPHHDQETNSKWLLDERGLFYYKVPIGYVIVKPWV